MATGGMVARMQKSRRPDDERDNLEEPMPGTGRTRGSRPTVAFRHSAFTRLIGQRSRPGDVLLRAVTKVQGARNQRAGR
jgi:hypothetical protein